MASLSSLVFVLTLLVGLPYFQSQWRLEVSSKQEAVGSENVVFAMCPLTLHALDSWSSLDPLPCRIQRLTGIEGRQPVGNDFGREGER